MPIPYNLDNQISMLWEKGIVGGQKLLYFILNQRTRDNQLQTRVNVDDTTITAGDPNWWQITSGLAAMEKLGFLKVGELPEMQIQWYLRKPQPVQLDEDKLKSDRTFMQPETYLKLALSSQGESQYFIDTEGFCTKFNIDRLDFLAGLGTLQESFGVWFPQIPVTMTQQGYLNLRSLTPDSLSLEKRDFIQSSPIWTFIVLRMLKGNEAAQAIDLNQLTPYGITEARLNADLIKFAAKELLTLSFGNLILTWKTKPSSLPPSEILNARGKFLTDLGYFAQALSSDGRLSIPQAEFCDRWKLTQAELTAGLTQLRSAGILDFSLGGSSITWLI